MASKDREFFDYCKEQWQSETAVLSSVSTITSHSAYQAIIGMGDIAIPLIIDELRKAPHHWFVALRKLTGENPVPEEHAGYMDQMAKDWVDWWDSKNKG